MKRIAQTVLSAALICCSAGIASAALMVDIPFNAPGDPAASGFAGDGTTPPTNDIAGGVWTNNRPAGTYGIFDGSGTGAISTIVGPVFHGWAEITATTFSAAAGYPDNRILAHGNATTGGVVAFQDGAMVFHAAGADTNQIIPVPNQDGQKHSYGWEHNRTTSTIKLFFDGLPVGNPLGYNASTGSYNGDMWFGDGGGGQAHNEVWDRVVMAEGAFPVIPEPSAMILFAVGAIGVAALRRRQRKQS